MILGCDRSKGGMTAVKMGPTAQIAISLFGFTAGSCPYQNVQPIRLATSIATEALEKLCDKLLQEGSSGDLAYAAARLQAALTKASSAISELGILLSMGLYVGGTVIYVIPGQALLLAFGGSTIYRLESHNLVQITGGCEDGLIPDALGAGGAAVKGVPIAVPEDLRLLAVSAPLEEEAQNRAAAILAENSADETHPDTASMLISQAILPAHAGPVLDCRLEGSQSL